MVNKTKNTILSLKKSSFHIPSETSSQQPQKDFLELTYRQLEELNLRAYDLAQNSTDDQMKQTYLTFLTNETRIKAATICFSDIEGRFHMLDYDKAFLLKSYDNLTFDGSSIKGFSMQHESDLRLEIDWSSIRFLPSDIFGPGKVIFFASVQNRDRSYYEADFRSVLKQYAKKLESQKGIRAYASAEVEGFLMADQEAEQNFNQRDGFKLISTGGYYHSLPKDPLRLFIDACAEAQRAMGFRNEKDHPEVAPSQFEMNFSYADVVRTCDNIQLYKLVCRQVARTMGMTATFLPKPITGINGSGMHVNMSMAKIDKKGAFVENLFFDAKGRDGISSLAWDAISRILQNAPDMCLVLNPSVNAYRRLDPAFEAPNQIKASAIDRGSMVRIPVGDKHSARIEVRSVAPDANPYLLLHTLVKVALEGQKMPKPSKQTRVRFLPSNIHDALKFFKASDVMVGIMGEEAKSKYQNMKQRSANRSPKDLGTIVKSSEIHFHHEITNQILWKRF